MERGLCRILSRCTVKVNIVWGLRASCAVMAEPVEGSRTRDVQQVRHTASAPPPSLQAQERGLIEQPAGQRTQREEVRVSLQEVRETTRRRGFNGAGLHQRVVMLVVWCIHGETAGRRHFIFQPVTRIKCHNAVLKFWWGSNTENTFV